MKKQIRRYIEAILACETQDEAYEKVFYGENGIDMAFQHDQISWQDHELLARIIAKMPER